MSVAVSAEPTAPRRSRWRIALLLAIALGCTLYFGCRGLLKADVGGVNPMIPIMASFYGPMIALLLFGLFWVVLGPWRFGGRLLAAAATVAVAAGFVFACHPKTRFVAVLWGIPSVAALAGAAVLLLPRRFAVGGIVVAAAAAVPWLTARIDGVTGTFDLVMTSRFEPTAEAREAAYRQSQPAEPAAAVEVAKTTAADWPAFRGAKRDSVAAAEASQGWTGTRPRELWRHPVGPAWSSFASVGDLAFTQEQRGDAEAVVCYRADTGREVWASSATERHEDMPAGPGPRATPAVADGRVYALGATNVLTCLDASNGQQIWAVKLAEALQAKKPTFGAAASPLVAGGLVIVNPAAKDAPRLAAFDAATGAKKWSAEGGTEGYSSPHLAVIDGVEQVLVFDGNGLGGYDPQSGQELWQYEWLTTPTEPASVQPLALADGRVVLGGGGAGTGTRCVRPHYDAGKWTVEELWKTNRFTPKFSDSVVVGDHLYGLDVSMVCVNLADGKRVWKDGKYGAGQVLLVDGKLLVLAENGQLACVDPKPEGWKELWRVEGLKGKTWNHMALGRGRLLLRNADEAAAFALAGGQ